MFLVFWHWLFGYEHEEVGACVCMGVREERRQTALDIAMEMIRVQVEGCKAIGRLSLYFACKSGGKIEEMVKNPQKYINEHPKEFEFIRNPEIDDFRNKQNVVMRLRNRELGGR